MLDRSEVALIIKKKSKMMFKMCSQSSSCEILKYSDKPITRHVGKEERHNNGSRKRNRRMHLSKEEDYYNCYREPGRVPFKWEIRPGVPKPPEIEGELRVGELRVDEDQSSPAPLKLPPSAHSASAAAASSSSQSITSSASPKKNGCYFSWNLSHLYRQPINLCQDSLQGGDIHVDHDTIRSNFELDSKEELSHVSNTDHLFHNDEVQLTTAPSSPARRALIALLLGVFPCSSMGKCFFIPSLKQKESNKRTVWGTGFQGKDSSSEISYGSTSHEPGRTSALNRTGCCNRYSDNLAAGIKQLRVETDECHSNEGGATLQLPIQMYSASTILL